MFGPPNRTAPRAKDKSVAPTYRYTMRAGGGGAGVLVDRTWPKHTLPIVGSRFANRLMHSQVDEGRGPVSGCNNADYSGRSMAAINAAG
ncbi:hypothetical protein MRX96_012507 [Rhipicephalus microplus]